MKSYDVAIIGTGPGGLSASLTLTNRNKSFLLFGSKDLSIKVSKAHTIKNYLGLPSVNGDDLVKAFKNHLVDMDITINDEKVTNVYQMGKKFVLQAKDMYEFKSIILATGVSTSKTFEGEDEHLGKGISYCATCDAPLYKNKEMTVVIDSIKEIEEVEFLLTVASKLKLVVMTKDVINIKNDKLEVIYDTPTKITKENDNMVLHTLKNEITSNVIFILRATMKASALIPGIEMDNNHVKVDRLMTTSVKGVYACGDIVGAPYQYSKAAGEGTIAAISCAAYLDKLDKEA
ncbi:MAG: NAD(P)/FAD-dependent oxidoreductase [Anaeroplasmataceae bacterium]